ncbi:MAG: TolC family protein, partial [Roseimicrobium sp.]
MTPRILLIPFLAALGTSSVFAGEGGAPEHLDLSTALRLAGAQNLDVKIAQERLQEAEARVDSATLQFFPWLSVGAGYRGHGDRTQTVEGDIIDADKQSLNAGGTATAQLDLGEAIYKRLVEKQKREAASYG